MYKRSKERYVQLKSKEWFEENTINNSGLYVPNLNASWGIWAEHVGKVVNIYSDDYIGKTTIKNGAYKSLEFGIEKEITKQTNPEYYL